MTIIIPDPLPENIITSYVVDPINSKSITLPLTSPIPNHHNNNHYYYHNHHQQYQCPVQSSSSEFQIKYIQTAPINFPSSSTSIPLTDVILPIKPTVTKQAQTVLPDQDLDHDNDQRIVPTSTTSYASFEITSGSISQSPYYSSLFLSPHNPPYEPDSLSSSPRQSQSQSQSNLQSNRNRNSNYNHNRCPQINTAGGSLMTRGGGGGIRREGFDGIVEERYSRFRPLDSQHNNEIIMIGLHPFQQENYGISKKNIFDSLTNWFKWKSSSSSTSSEIPPPLISSNQIINHQEDKSSDDDNNNHGNDNDNDNETIIITQEHNDFTPQPVYTPRGIPINEFPLNFNKEQNEENNLTRCRNEDIINSFDDDVRDLINGVDNFLISCLENCWNLIKSTSESCITLCD